ncbi:8398_t:CDS:2, partial [Racocetra fulgida]
MAPKITKKNLPNVPLTDIQYDNYCRKYFTPESLKSMKYAPTKYFSDQSSVFHNALRLIDAELKKKEGYVNGLIFKAAWQFVDENRQNNNKKDSSRASSVSLEEIYIPDQTSRASSVNLEEIYIHNLTDNGDQLSYRKFDSPSSTSTDMDLISTFSSSNQSSSEAPKQYQKEQKSILISQNEVLKVKNREIEERNHTLEIENTNHKVKNKETEERNHTLEKENTNLKVKNKEIEERNHVLETDNINLKVKNKETEERNHTLESQNTILKTENADLKIKDDNYTKLKTKYAVLDSEHGNLKSLYKDLEAKITESEINLRDINKKYSELLTEHSNLEVIYAALEDNYKALQAKDGKNEEEIKILEKELKETQDEKDKKKEIPQSAYYAITKFENDLNK